jgi:hypothetical protein
MAVPASLRLKLLRFAASTKAVRTLSSPPRDYTGMMKWVCSANKPRWTPLLITRRQLGAATLEGDKNNSSGFGCLTLGGICPSQSTIILFCRRCFSPVCHQRPKASATVSAELDSSRRCAEQRYLHRSECGWLSLARRRRWLYRMVNVRFK